MLETLVYNYYSFLETIGLGTFPARFVFGAGAGFLAQLVVSPSVSYNEDGTAKPFVFFTDSEEEESTYLPWYLWPLLLGIVAVLFM